jgi:hypothetical protein
MKEAAAKGNPKEQAFIIRSLNVPVSHTNKVNDNKSPATIENKVTPATNMNLLCGATEIKVRVNAMAYKTTDNTTFFIF